MSNAQRRRGLRTSFAIASVAAGLFSAAASVDAAILPFTPGDLLVVRAAGGPNGDATAPLGGGGQAAAVFIDEYTPVGALVQSVPLPATANATVGGQRALTLSGTQNTEGTIQVSGNGQYFIIAGYNQTATVSGSSNVASTTVERVVGRIDMSGNIDTTTALVDAMSAQAIRSAYSTNGTDFWVTGNGGNNVTVNAVPNITTSGVHYAQLGVNTGGNTLSTQVNPAGLTANNRVVSVANGQLFVTSGNTSNPNAPARGVNYMRDTTADNTPIVPSNNTNGLFSLTGMPTTTTGSPTPSNPLPDDYWFKDADTLYLADERADASNLGGIQKWLRTAGSGTAALGDDVWAFQYVLPLGATGTVTANGLQGGVVAAHGLSGTFDGLTTTLYATAFEAGGNANRLWAVVDGGSAAASTSTALALSATNTAFRGVEVVVPEPGTLSLLGVAGLAALRRRRRA